MPAIGNLANQIPALNLTGGLLANAALIAIVGWDTASSLPMVNTAIANGTNRRADGILMQAVQVAGAGYYYKEFLLENQNTAGRAIGDPVYLDPAVAGGYTFTQPTGAGQDIQEIGVVLTVNAATGRILFTIASGAVGQAASSISDVLLASKMYRDIGTVSFATLLVSGVGGDGERITITVGATARIYEFDTAAPPGAIGAGANIRVGISGAGGDQANTAAGCIAALVAAINADTSRVCNAIDLGGNLMGILALASGTSLVVQETMPNGAWNTPVAGVASGTQRLTLRSYALTAQDVTDLANAIGVSEVIVGTFNAIASPAIVLAQAFTAAGSPQLLDGSRLSLQQANATTWALAYREPGAGALLAAGDRLTFALLLAD